MAELLLVRIVRTSVPMGSASPISPVWFELLRMSELSEYLQSVPSHELTKKVASEISELGLTYRPRRIVVQEFILLAKQFMTEFFAEIRPEVETHAYNYPFLQFRIP